MALPRVATVPHEAATGQEADTAHPGVGTVPGEVTVVVLHRLDGMAEGEAVTVLL